MATILSYEIIQNYKPCSLNNKPRITQIIKEVEKLEIAKTFGVEVYNQLVTDANTSPMEEDVQAILEGGLYEAISYFVYAQYVIESQVADTFTGMVTKNRPDSENVQIGTLKNMQTHAREIASFALEQVRCQIEQKYCTREQPTKNHDVQIINIKRRNNKRGFNSWDFDTNYFD